MKQPLTRRELEVLRLVAAHKSNKQIATELHLSQYTVKNHIHNAIMKLDAHGRMDAACTGLNMKPTGDTRCGACPLAAKAAVVAAEMQKLADELKGQ